jgi:large conductance mechanosensitive channel
MFKEFGEFIKRGNVIDLAVGVIIGGAFGKIIIRRQRCDYAALGLLLGKVNFASLFIDLSGKGYETLELAKEAGAPTLNYGPSSRISLISIVAFVVFLVVRQINKMKKAEEPLRRQRRPARIARPKFRSRPSAATLYITVVAKDKPGKTEKETRRTVCGALNLA